MSPTIREMEREIERLRQPTGEDGEELRPLSVAQLLSAEKGDIKDTPVDDVVYYAPRGEYRRLIDWGEYIPEQAHEWAGDETETEGADADMED